MNNELFLEHYTGQSTNELLALENSHRIDSLVLAFEEALEDRKTANQDLSPVETTVLAITAFMREIDNGGFSQFFYNSSVEYAPIIVDALDAVGAEHCSQLAQRAIDALNLETLLPEAIEERLDPDDDELESLLSELDDIYYEESEELDLLLFDFIKENANACHLDAA
jgi:hypothetical protein